MFNSRLEEYRYKLNLNRRQVAEKLEISESYYNLISSGKRKPSRTVLNKLVLISQLPEEYWLYGINKEENSNDNFKSLEKALDTILELMVVKSAEEIFDENNEPIDSLGKLLINALKNDIKKIIEKKNSGKYTTDTVAK